MGIQYQSYGPLASGSRHTRQLKGIGYRRKGQTPHAGSKQAMERQGSPKGADLRQTWVVKTLWPGQAGTVKLSRRYGDALVCVRYRHDAKGEVRYTTVEVMIDQAALPKVFARHDTQSIHLAHTETDLRAQAICHGAKWDEASKLWRLTTAAVKALGLESRLRRPVRKPKHPPNAPSSGRKKHTHV